MKYFKRSLFTIILLGSILSITQCKNNDVPPDSDPENPEETNLPEGFYFGADLSYVNQVLDYNGIFLDQGEERSPYKIFKDHGTNLVRLRLWHNPTWTMEVYGEEGTQMYSDLFDVEKSIGLAKAQGMEVLLDFHYSDTWADPGHQDVPAAWKDITDIEVLKDSVYQYTKQTLEYLNGKGLMPELVQIGNETNCGMMTSEAGEDFPGMNVCDGNWSNMGDVINSGIQAVREVNEDTKIILHVADPQHVDWWFTNITSGGGVSDFDMIGFSYYPLWHTTVSVPNLSVSISSFKSKFNKEVIILETAYPWTTEGNDDYNNLFGGDAPISGYPYTPEGQLDIMRAMTQEVIDGGGIGIIYWEPAWISSDMKDLWGTGSSWENNAFFDFDGNVIEGIGFMNYNYE